MTERRKLDFPDPIFPIIPINYPFSREKLILSRIFFRLSSSSLLVDRIEFYPSDISFLSYNY